MLLRGTFSSMETTLGSTMRELLGVMGALKLLLPHVANTCVRIFSDNSGVVACLDKMYSKNERIRAVLLQLTALMVQYSFSIIPSFIPGSANTVADYISRLNMGDTCMLHP